MNILKCQGQVKKVNVTITLNLILLQVYGCSICIYPNLQFQFWSCIEKMNGKLTPSVPTLLKVYISTSVLQICSVRSLGIGMVEEFTVNYFAQKKWIIAKGMASSCQASKDQPPQGSKQHLYCGVWHAPAHLVLIECLLTYCSSPDIRIPCHDSQPSFNSL